VTTSYLEAAREIRTLLDALAIKSKGDPVSPEAIDAMASAELFGVMTPREVGGAELPLNDVIDVFAEVARADGSTGWCLMAAASTVAYFGAYGGQSFVDELFADGTPLAAGQFAPNGTGVPDGDGFRISGNYQFGSGIHYAAWVGAGFLVHPPEGSDAGAQYWFTLVPKRAAELQGNWDVLGLQSTASFDYSLDDVYSSKEASFLFAAPTRHRGGPLYELGVVSLTAAGHAGFALGVTQRALDELRSIAKTKIRMGSGSFLKESERFLASLGRLESRFRAARAWVRECFDEAERDVRATERANPRLSHLVRQATVFVTEEGADIVREAYLLAGTTSLREGALQRCFRDIHAGSQHFFASPASTLEFARGLMDIAPDSALDA
jgi:alkylation response protein AidB-like acyl-CoA dehydrogenase